MSSFWDIIIPEATTNLFTDPSIEIGTTGWDAFGGTAISRVTTKRRRGVGCMQIAISSTSSTDGAFYDTFALTSGQDYTLSLDMYAEVGQTMQIGFGDTDNAVVGTPVAVSGIAKWHRYSVSYASTATGNFNVIVNRSVDCDTGTAWIDGLQLENKDHATTYCDGDQEGCEWTGGDDASTSTRPATTREGGRVYDLSSYGFYVIELSGVGMAPVESIEQAYALLPGGEYAGYKVQTRTFALIGEAVGSSRPDLHSKRKSLIDAIKPDRVGEAQPFILRYRGSDTDETPILIECVYGGGLEFGGLEGFSEKIGIRLIAHDPYFREEGNDAAVLTTTQEIADADYILMYKDGQWQEMLNGMDEKVYALALAPDQSIYAGGAFTEANGDTDCAKVAKWNGTAWSALSTGLSATVYALAVAADGTLYAGGFFTEAGGDSNANKIASWNGSAWSAMGLGADDDTVFALTIGLDGTLYAGGAFTGMGGVANTARIAKWNGTAWSALGSTGGADGTVYALAVGVDGAIYAGGSFTMMGGVDNTAYIAKWNGSAWSALGSTGMGDAVYALTVAPNGDLYAAGDFTTASGTTANRIARWNGAAWSALSNGLGDSGLCLAYTESGLLLVGGEFTNVGSLNLTDRMVLWNGSTFAHMDVELPNLFDVLAILPVKDDIYIGFEAGGAAQASYINTVTNSGTAATYPVYKIKRSGGTTAVVTYLKNITNGKTIWMDYSLQDGEELTVNFEPKNLNCESSFFGKVWRAILKNSDVSQFVLQPGSNSIAAFAITSGSPTITATLEWKVKHWSIDGVAA